MTDPKPRVVAEFRCGEDGGTCGRLVGTLTRERFGGDVEYEPSNLIANVAYQRRVWEGLRLTRCRNHGWVGLVDDYAEIESKARRHRGKPPTYFLQETLSHFVQQTYFGPEDDANSIDKLW